MSVQSCSNTTHQVFIVGIGPNGFGGRKYTYTANVDLQTATTDNLLQVISSRTGIQLALLRYQFQFLKRGGGSLIQGKSLASQGINREDTLRLEWWAGLSDNAECPICIEEISSVDRRLPVCQQTLENGTVQTRTHRTAFHTACLENLKQDGSIKCPLCNGKVSADSTIIP